MELVRKMEMCLEIEMEMATEIRDTEIVGGT
jgi:hypothetical protein